MSRAAILVTGLTAISTLLGFVRDIVIAAVYGAGTALDAYWVAQGLMNILLGLVGYSMMRSVTPVVAREVAAEGGDCRGHRSFNVALTVTMVVLGAGSVVMGILAGPVAGLIAPGFDGEAAQLLEMLTRIVLVATVVIAATDLLAALSQAHGRFAWSSLQGVPFNVIMIAAAGLFGPHYGITALAVGFVVGSVARLVLQIPPLVSLGTKIRPGWNLGDPGFREIAWLVPPMLVGNAVVNVNTLVDRAVASTLDEGAVSALAYGWRLVNLPETLIVAALLVPLYPALSAAANNPAEIRRMVGRGLSVTVTVLVPVCLVIAIAALPLVQLVFARGAFDSEDAAVTAAAVAWFTPGLLALGCRQVVVSTSYAVGDSKAPVVVAIGAMVINVTGDILLAPVLGVAGIALATSVSLLMAAAVNGWMLRYRYGGIDVSSVGALLVRAGSLAVVAAAAGLGVRELVPGQSAFLSAAAIAAVVCGVYALGLIVLRAPERHLLMETLRAVRRKGK
ncbi:murein biosynthesis integral membrane protein MurJ [Arthrobacter pigmenti]